ncbi:TetR/AcrR family transcriptional regulator [Actinocorallia aurantiaca]|uniref:Tetracyclin repressor-like C-terminal domain-containing protein n=1 Tax=Actinocorallia aurantiaca TaxID=46204 RepID=A0ABP6G787_9ACTN
MYAEAVQAEIPRGLAGDPSRPPVHIADALLREVVFGDWQMFDGEHPLLVMLRSANRPAVREQLRTQLCEGYLREFTDRLEGENAELRVELIGALLLGMGVMRSIADSPALGEASFEETRVLVARLVHALSPAG